MDAMRGMDPSTSMFHTQATRNMSQIGFGAVRSQKEVAPQQEEEHTSEVHDNVCLSSSDPDVGTEEKTENAAMSGELAELLDDYDDDDEEVKERRDRNERGEISQFSFEEKENRIDGIRSTEDVNRLNQMDDASAAVRDILKDVPERSLEPARNIVSNQVQNGRPAEALVAMKPVEGVNAVDFQPAPQIGLLDIHDTGNKPISQDPEENVSAEFKQEAAEDQMNKLISNLPDDKKEMVEELRTAVNAWAGANGVNAQSAFAERLKDLASGWDDDSLMAATQSYSDASREINASSATAG